MLNTAIAFGADWFLTFSIIGMSIVAAYLTLDVLKVNGFWEKKASKK